MPCLSIPSRLVPALAAAFLLLPLGVQASEGTITAALSSDVPSIDGSMDSSPMGYNVRLNIYDQLAEILADGSVGPRLATSWEASADAKVWTFTIRRNAKFHNGAPVTIDDVVWTYNKIVADTRSPVRTFLNNVKSVTKLDDDRVRIELQEPFGVFERQAAIISILPRQAYEEMGAEKFGQTPIGSGPYRLVRWVKDDRIEMEAFQDYWNGAPKLKTAILRPVPADAARASALLSGEVDIVPALPPAMVERLSGRRGVKVEKADGLKSAFVGFNTNVAPLNDLKVRQAIDLAIDREALINRLLRGLGMPSGQAVVPSVFGYDPAIKASPYDPAKARELLKASSYKGEKIPFQYPTTFIPGATETAQAIAGQLEAIGIAVEMQAMEWTAFFPMWASRKVNGMYLFAFSPSPMDADWTLTALYRTNSRGYWLDPTVEQLSAQQRATTDAVKRKELISKIWTLSRENVAYANLYSEIQAFGLRDGVEWAPRPDGFLRFFNIAPPKRS